MKSNNENALDSVAGVLGLSDEQIQQIEARLSELDEAKAAAEQAALLLRPTAVAREVEESVAELRSPSLFSQGLSVFKSAASYGVSAVSAGASAVSHGASAVAQGVNVKNALADTGSAAAAMITPTTFWEPSIRRPLSADDMLFSKVEEKILSDLDLDNSKLPQKGNKLPQKANKFSFVSGIVKDLGTEVLFATGKGGVSYVHDASRTLGNSATRMIKKPWGTQSRKETFQKGVGVIKTATVGVLAELDCMTAMNGMLLEMSKQIATGVEVTLTGPVAEGLERVGYVRAATEGATNTVTSLLAQKNLNAWIAHLEKAGVYAQKSTLVESLMMGCLKGASGAYKIASVWNMMTLIQEAPPVFDSISKLGSFIKNPDAEEHAYINGEIKRIKSLLPKSEPWPDGDFPTRLALYQALTSSVDNERCLTTLIKGAAWSVFCEKTLSAVDGIIGKAGQGLGGVAAGLAFRATYSVDEAVAAKTFSASTGVESDLYKCLFDTAGYYAINTLIEKTGGYLVSQVLKGIVHKQLMAQKERFLKKTEDAFRSILRDQFFNPDELDMVDCCQKRSASVAAAAELDKNIQDLSVIEAILLLKAASKGASSSVAVSLLRKKVITGEPSLIKTAIDRLPDFITMVEGGLLFVAAINNRTKAPLLEYPGKVLEEWAGDNPYKAGGAAAVGIVGGIGYGIGPRVVASAVTAAATTIVKNPYVAAGVVAAGMTYHYAPSFRAGVDTGVNYALSGVNYVVRSPALLATVGVGLAVAAADPLLAVSFAAPAISTVLRTGGAGAVKAATNIFGFVKNNFWAADDVLPAPMPEIGLEVKPAAPAEQVVLAAAEAEQVVLAADPAEQVVLAADPAEQVVLAADPAEQVVLAADPAEQVVL
ncbi:MAG: hypothetical protein ACHP65_08820, partial [Legionellales bacterium]